MPPAPKHLETEPPAAGHFLTTRWSVVLAATGEPSPAAADALNRLCAAYWYPLYAWMRCRGSSHHDAQDLNQAFFVHLLDQERLRTTGPHKGRFRSFLLASLKNFLANEHDKAQALKRGGQFTIISMDEEQDESRFKFTPSHHVTPDQAFEQNWAVTLLEAVLGQLREEYTRANKAALFDALQNYLSGDRGLTPYAELAVRMKMSEAALKMAVLRLRRRFGERLRQEIAHTVTTEAEIDGEIRALFAAVRR